MNAWSWFIDGRMRLMTMSFSKPGDAPLDGEEELGHAAGRELAQQRVLAEATGQPSPSASIRWHRPPSMTAGARLTAGWSRWAANAPRGRPRCTARKP